MTKQTRTWATPAQTLLVAQWVMKQGATESKDLLAKSNYVVTCDDTNVNVDYRSVDAMIYVLSSVIKAVSKPKHKAKAQPSVIE